MPEFHYTGVDKAGKKISGKLDAPGEGDVRMALRGQGIRPVRIRKAGALNTDIGSLLRGGVVSVPISSLVIMTRQLHVLITSGIPLLQSLEILSEQSVHGGLKSILSAVKEKVSRGSFFWEALSVYSLVFPKIYIALIRAGEASGSMDQMLKRLSRYLEDAEHLRKKVKGAMMYPGILCTIGVGVIVLMMLFVIPKFEELLKSNKQELPAPTQFVITSAHFLMDNIVTIIAVTVTTIFIVVRYLRTSEGRALKDRIMFQIPIFRPLLQKSGIARFARTMQTLLASGVNLLDAVDICRDTIDNTVLEEAVGKIRVDIEAGKTLGMVVNKLEVFPKMAVHMIQIGESTGNLDKMLEKIADFYESDVEELVANLGKVIEPLVLVFLGGAIGGMMIAMYLPIFKLAGGAD